MCEKAVEKRPWMLYYLSTVLVTKSTLIRNLLKLFKPRSYLPLAWGNFDEADSAHHTYVVCYQTLSSTIQVPQKVNKTTR